MSKSFRLRAALSGLVILVAGGSLATPLPDFAGQSSPVRDSAGGKPASEKAVLAGGCFWGLQAVFEHVKGVSHVTAGYAGGSADTAQYETVSSGTTGHAESVEITYDPAQISFGQLLKVYFGVAHNPTELNRQDPDEGTQYRSSIFFTDPAQEKTAREYIAQLDAAKTFPKPIVTQVTPLKAFYAAEAYHQDYAQLHPHQPYIATYDLPKVADLRKELPNLYIETPTN